MSSRRRRKQARAKKKEDTGVAEDATAVTKYTGRTYRSSLEEDSTPALQPIVDTTPLESLGDIGTPYRSDTDTNQDTSTDSIDTQPEPAFTTRVAITKPSATIGSSP